MIIRPEDIMYLNKLKAIAKQAEDRKPLPKPKEKKTEYDYHKRFIN